MKNIILTFFVLNSTFFIASAQPGSLDPTFCSDGKVTTVIGDSTDAGNSVAIQTDGKIVVAGYSNNGANNDFALVRYNTDCSLDSTFSSDGKITTDFSNGNDICRAVAIQNDGKIVMAGYSYNSKGLNNDFALVRYNTDCSLDNTFSSDGKVTTAIGSGDDECNSVAIQSDGKILVAGTVSDDFGLVRYNTDGSLDNTFSSDGKVTTDFGGADYGYSVAIQDDGKILVAGTVSNDFGLVRYNTDGSLDSTFSSDGKVTTDFVSGNDFGRAVAIQSDGKIVVAGSSYDGSRDYFAVVRYNNNGSLDNTFSSDGKVTMAPPPLSWANGKAVAIQSDGKILVAGDVGYSSYVFALARFNSDGSSDNTFSFYGTATTDIGSGSDYGKSVAIQSDGKIVVAGQSSNGSNNDFAVVRYNVVCPPPVNFSQTLSLCTGQSITVGIHTYTTNGTYDDTLTAYNGCDSIVTSNLTFLSTTTYTWTGAVSTAWNTAGNWSSGIVPDKCNPVIIPGTPTAPTQPTISVAGAKCKNITIDQSTGGKVTISGSGTLTVSD